MMFLYFVKVVDLTSESLRCPGMSSYRASCSWLMLHFVRFAMPCSELVKNDHPGCTREFRIRARTRGTQGLQAEVLRLQLTSGVRDASRYPIIMMDDAVDGEGLVERRRGDHVASR